MTGLCILGSLVVTSVAFYITPWPALYVPLAILLAVLTWQRLDLALPLIPFLLPNFMMPKHIGSRLYPVHEIFLAIDLFIVAGYLCTSRRHQLRLDLLRGSPFIRPAMLFVIAATMSTALAVDHHHAERAYLEMVIEPLAFFASY